MIRSIWIFVSGGTSAIWATSGPAPEATALPENQTTKTDITYGRSFKLIFLFIRHLTFELTSEHWPVRVERYINEISHNTKQAGNSHRRIAPHGIHKFPAFLI